MPVSKAILTRWDPSQANGAPGMARAAAAAGRAAAPGGTWGAAAPRTIRTRMMARTAK